MPSRLFTAAILVFWLSMTAWLIDLEIVPMLVADVSSTYQIDLTHEIGSPQVNWSIWWVSNENGREIKDHIGEAESKIRPNHDGSYEFRFALRIFKDDKFNLGPIRIQRLESYYRVTEEGKLLSSRATVNFQIREQPMTGGFKGEIVGDLFEPCLFWDSIEKKLNKINLPQQGSIVNPMHPVNRLRGLHQGQTWKITLMDPLSIASKTFLGDFPALGMAIPSLIAEVKHDRLLWNRKEVPCYKIEYSEPGKDVTARTWVRRSDGLVLRQDASHFGYEVVSERKPD